MNCGGQLTETLVIEAFTTQLTIRTLAGNAVIIGAHPKFGPEGFWCGVCRLLKVRHVC